MKASRPSRHHAPRTGDVATEDLPDLLVASGLHLNAANKLRARSIKDPPTPAPPTIDLFFSSSHFSLISFQKVLGGY
jgi:hypothetical protein